MPYKKQWNWGKATEGMQVLVKKLRRDDARSGVVKEVKGGTKIRMTDGKSVRSMHVDSVTVLCDDGLEIVAEKHTHQIILK